MIEPSLHWLPYVCNPTKEMRMTVMIRVGWLAYWQKLAKFSEGLGSSSRGAESLPAYILPNGNRDNDVPVVVAVSTIRKR